MRIVVWEKDQKTRQLLYAQIDNYIKDYSCRICLCTSWMRFLMEIEEGRLEEQPEIFVINIEEDAEKRIALAKELRTYSSNAAIIFISQSTEYFEAAFEAEPVYIMLKPLKPEVLENALSKALKKVAEVRKPYLILKGKNLRRIFLEDIYYIESEARKLKLHCVHGMIEQYGRLDEIEESIQNDFVRCHKSYLVNMRYVSSMDGKEVKLLNGKTIPISRSKVISCKETITDYFQRKSVL